MVKFFSRIFDLGVLTYYFIISNRKAILVSMIGLSIALAVIAENWFLADSYKGEILKESGHFGISIGDIHIQIHKEEDSSNLNPYFDLNSFSEMTYNSFEMSRYQKCLASQSWYTNFDLKPTPQNDTSSEDYDQYFVFKIPTNQFFDSISNSIYGRLPENPKELIIVKPKYEYERNPWWEPDWEKLFPSGVLGKQVNITAYPEENSFEKPNNISLTIVGCLEYELVGWQQTSFDDIVSEQIHKYFLQDNPWNWIREAPTFFITFSDYIKIILGQIKPINGSMNVFPHIIGKWFLDYAKIDAFNIDSEIKKVEDTIRNFVKEYIQNGYVSQGFDLRINPEIIDRLKSFKSRFLMTQMLYQIFSTPLIAIALYLVFYSHNLIKRQKEMKIGIIKTRGGTRLQIILFLWGELVVGIVVAIIGGLIIGYQLAGIARSTIDLLEFSGKVQYGSIHPIIIQDLISWAIILAICLQFLNILRISKTSIQKSIEPLDKLPPLWSKYYLDIIATVIGLLGIFLIDFLTSSVLVDLPILNVLLPILIIPAPFIFFFGFIFFLSRLFPWLSGLIANLLWQYSGGVKAFSLRNLVRHKHSANRAVIIITLALMYSVFSGTFIYYMDENYRIRNYLAEGAEIRIKTQLSNHIMTGTQLQNISEIASVSEIISCSIWQEKPYFELRFFFIDPYSFAETAYFIEGQSGLSSPLATLMNRICENKSIIVYEKQLDFYAGKKIGDSINYFLNIGTSNITLSFIIQGTFRYWPHFNIDSEGLRYSHFLVGSLSLFKELNKSIPFSSVETNYFIKPEPKANLFQLINEIEDTTGLRTYSPSIQHRDYLSSFFRIFLLSTLNSNLLICITISVVSVTMFAFFTYIQRSKEIGVERAFGMTRNQVTTSFIIEGSVLLLFSCIISLILGLLYSNYIADILLPSGDEIPRFSIFPLDFLVKLIAGVIFGSAIGITLPAFLASKKNISQILKND